MSEPKQFKEIQIGEWETVYRHVNIIVPQDLDEEDSDAIETYLQDTNFEDYETGTVEYDWSTSDHDRWDTYGAKVIREGLQYDEGVQNYV